ncbi:cation diffusion facilitator family transporter [Candidatus Nitrosotenuis chungbukensis]|uniref:cation diffusion facilitator family transporter n=1 Tax=Candidatus Nitrosotenuis chungbukensis TaxID=1353246 RepID=UPI0005B2B2CC|nr:cation diffusion facilitator family transporter [Candidatus Nitrosotenuis chungbukensis]WKT57502.1 cation diffusion facilitator family transporter [Candidatus Nitrosotenuis chungbukensis]
MAVGSKKAVYAALFGNLGVAISKFVAALFTGSAAMWAEAYHSASDTFNQVLLLFGMKTSVKAASYQHQFGYGRDLFFWSFIVATMLFGISGILSLENGASSLLHGNYKIENVQISYIILVIAFGFEANALRIALKQFTKGIRGRGEKITPSSMINEFKESKDTVILTVIVEDSAALLGIAIAAIGIFLSDMTGNSVYDGIASLLIGSILMFFAFFLAKENRGLIIGESITAREYRRIVKSINDIPEVNRVITMRTMHLGLDDILIGVQVNLIDNLDTDKIEVVTDIVEQKIMEIIPKANREHIFVEIERERIK